MSDIRYWCREGELPDGLKGMFVDVFDVGGRWDSSWEQPLACEISSALELVEKWDASTIACSRPL